MVDPRAASGFAGTAGSYERGRPSYAVAAVERAVRELGLGPTSTVIDLAAGTGKLTRLLPGRVVAVDPSASMLATLREQLPSVETRAGAAEEIPAADGSVDAVFVGQAFHWFRAAEAARSGPTTRSPHATGRPPTGTHRPPRGRA